MIGALRRRMNVWLALMLREIATRGSETRLRYLIIMLEPFGQLAMMYSVFLFIDRKPDFGQSLFLFLATGIIPYFLFTHVCSRVTGALRSGAKLRDTSLITGFDQAFSRLILETLIVVLMAVGVLGVSTLLDVPGAVPVHPLVLVTAITSLALLAFGVGMVNASLILAFGAYAMIWSVISRSLIFFTGVFYSADYLSPRLRYVLSFNPTLHGAILFRAGVYNNYPVLTFDPAYLFWWILCSIALGLVLMSGPLALRKMRI